MAQQATERGPLSNEARVVLALAADVAADRSIDDLLVAPVDWSYLLRLSLQEGAQPIVGRRLRALTGDSVPTEVREHLARVERVAEFRALYLERRAREVLELLSNAGIRTVLLKGAALALTVYPSFVERQMADIDLLLEPGELARAESLLRDAGWQRRFEGDLDDLYAGMHHRPPLTDSRGRGLGVGLELHSELFPPMRNPFGLRAERVWQDARRVDGFPETVLVPSAMNLVMHCCTHFAWSHCFRRAAWRTFRDLAMLLAGIDDWQAIVEEAERLRCESCCYWTLRLANRLADLPVPADVLDQLRPAVPTAVLSILELHLCHEMIVSESICPSIRLRRLAWEAAIRPNRSGHGAVRPWDDGESWHLLASPEEKVIEQRHRESSSAAAWLRYFRAIAPGREHIGRRPQPTPAW